MSPAPVGLRFEVEVEASPAPIWELLVDVEGWPRWHPGLHFAVLRGDLSIGTRVDWRVDGMRIRSRVADLDPPRVLALSLKMIGGSGYARWELDEHRQGFTRVTLEEEWRGVLVRLLAPTLRRTLEVSRSAALEGLRRRAEAAG